MPRRRKEAGKQINDAQYDMYLSARMELAESEQAMEADYQGRPEVQEAMKASGETRAKDALSKMIVRAMTERHIDKEEYEDGSRVSVQSSERRSLDRTLLIDELERREVDPDDIVAIVEAAAAVTSFQSVRVHFPKVERARGDKRLRR